MTGPINPDVKATAANIGQILENAKIPNLLFGWTALALVLVDREFPQIDFIIPDDLIEHAVETLENAGYKVCKQLDCTELHEDRGPDVSPFERYHPIADAHFHLASGHLLSLLKKEDMIPHLPDLKLGLPEKKEYEYVTLSVDPRLRPRPKDWKRGSGPSGPWYDLPPVRVLLGKTLTEALLLLRCRHIDEQPVVDNLWRDMLWEIRRTHTPYAFRNEKPLKGHLQEYWEWFAVGSTEDTEEDRLEKYERDEVVRRFRSELTKKGKDPTVKHGRLWKKVRNYG